MNIMKLLVDLANFRYTSAKIFGIQLQTLGEKKVKFRNPDQSELYNVSGFRAKNSKLGLAGAEAENKMQSTDRVSGRQVRNRK